MLHVLMGSEKSVCELLKNLAQRAILMLEAAGTVGHV